MTNLSQWNRVVRAIRQTKHPIGVVSRRAIDCRAHDGIGVECEISVIFLEYWTMDSIIRITPRGWATVLLVDVHRVGMCRIKRSCSCRRKHGSSLEDSKGVFFKVT